MTKLEHLPWNLETEPHKLRQARIKLRRSQETVAKLLGVTHAAYNRWEMGHATPAPDRREKLWKLINLAERQKEA